MALATTFVPYVTAVVNILRSRGEKERKTRKTWQVRPSYLAKLGKGIQMCRSGKHEPGEGRQLRCRNLLGGDSVATLNDSNWDDG